MITVKLQFGSSELGLIAGNLSARHTSVSEVDPRFAEAVEAPRVLCFREILWGWVSGRVAVDKV